MGIAPIETAEVQEEKEILKPKEESLTNKPDLIKFLYVDI